MSEVKYPVGISQEQIDQWKKKFPHSKIFIWNANYNLNGEVTPFSCVARTPDREIVNKYLKLAKDPEKSSKILIANCVLSGGESLEAHDDLYYGMMKKLADLIPDADVRTSKLDRESLPEGITAAMVDEWEKKYGADKLLQIEAEVKEGTQEFKGVIRTPDRFVITDYLRLADNPRKSSESLVKNCVLHGVKSVLDDDGLFFGTLRTLADLIPDTVGDTVFI